MALRIKTGSVHQIGRILPVRAACAAPPGTGTLKLTEPERIRKRPEIDMNEPTRPEAEQAIASIAAALQNKRLTINALDDGSGVVLDVDGEQMLTANATGMRIIQAIDEGDKDATAIARHLAGQFEVSEQQASEDVVAFVARVADGL